MAAIESLIFDLDGTLWDTCESCAIAWNEVLEREKIPFRKITAEDIRGVTGRPHEDCVRTVFKGLSEEQIQSLIAGTAHEDIRVIEERGGELYPFVKEGLTQLSKKHRLFIVSNCQTGYIETFLRLLGLGVLFTDHECFGDTGNPKGQNILALMARNQIESAIYVGDMMGDETAARVAGVPYAFVEYGFGDGVDVDLRSESFADFCQNIESLEAGASNKLETKNLLLRPFVLADASDFFELTQDEGFNAHTITNYRQESLASSRRWIFSRLMAQARDGMTLWGVWLKSSGALIGACGLRPTQIENEAQSRVEVTYRLRESAWGKGFGFEAAKVIVDDGFSRLGLREIVATIAATNVASEAFARKLKMKFDRKIQHLGVETHLYTLSGPQG